MSQKITLECHYDKNDSTRTRKITFPIDQISIEDWFETGNWKEAVPNACKVTFGSNFYRVKESRKDLEARLEDVGVKIHRK